MNIRQLRAIYPALLCIGCTCAVAEEPADPGKWQFAGELFALGASVDGTAATGEDIDVPLHDVLDSLDFGFMGSLAARKDKWTLFADFIYVDLGDQASIPLNQPMAAQADLNVDLKQFISTFGAGYEVARSDRSSLSLLAGGRYLSVDLDLDYSIPPSISGRDSISESNLDFIVGARGRTDLSQKWYIHYYADVGTGDSDLTWQALAGINYRFSKVDLTLGYAYMDWDFGNDTLVRDLSLSGPYAGIKFRF